MCFLLDQKNKIPIVITNDITVYKIGYFIDYLGMNLFSSYFRNFSYAVDELCEIDEFPIIRNEKGLDVLDSGFHSFIKITQKVKNMVSLPLRLAKFIITKGSLCLKNEELNEIVSNQIIFKGLTNV